MLSRKYSYAFAITTTVLLSYCLIHFYHYSNSGWLFLTAFLVSPITRGPSLRQGLLHAILLMLTIFLANFLLLGDKFIPFSTTILAIIFICIGYFSYFARSHLTLNYYAPFLVFIVLFNAYFDPFIYKNFMNTMFDVLIGATIGIIIPQIFLLRQPYPNFRSEILPYLHTMMEIIEKMSQPKELIKPVTFEIDKFKSILSILTKESLYYPIWVYETGFNRAVRSSYRYYLINLEQLFDLLIIFQNALTKTKLDKKMIAAVAQVMQGNFILLNHLKNYFIDHQLIQYNDEQQDDIDSLDKYVNQHFPHDIDYIEFDSSLIALQQLIRALKDFRFILLKLYLGLPKNV